MRIPEILVKSDENDHLIIPYVLYDIVLNEDLKSLEKRLYKTICFFLDKYEKVNRVKDFNTIIDRFVACNDIY